MTGSVPCGSSACTCPSRWWGKFPKPLASAQGGPAPASDQRRVSGVVSQLALVPLVHVRAGPQPKVILVTSAIPKEGKTTVASNLAITLAMSGSRVLLVDADFRRGSVHRIFSVSLKPGLLEVLSQGVSPAQVIVPTAESNLYVFAGWPGRRQQLRRFSAVPGGPALEGSRRPIQLHRH